MYEPPKEDESPVSNITHWEKKAKWLVDVVGALEEVISEKYDKTTITTTYTQSYARINIDGKVQYFIHQRSSPNIFLEFPVKDEEKKAIIEKLLADNNIMDANYNNYKSFTFTTNKAFILKHKQLFHEIHTIKDRELPNDDE